MEEEKKEEEDNWPLEEKIREARRLAVEEQREQQLAALEYKSILCPLGVNCSKDNRMRWPAQNTKCTTKFGQACPFAHHRSEIFFPEYLGPKLNKKRVEAKVKNIEKKMENENPMDAWVPQSSDPNGRIHNKPARELHET